MIFEENQVRRRHRQRFLVVCVDFSGLQKRRKEKRNKKRTSTTRDLFAYNSFDHRPTHRSLAPLPLTLSIHI